MVNPGPGSTALEQRHRAAVRLAREYMQRLRLTQTGLAERLGVAPSTLSRFLSGDPQALPAPERPGKLAILEGIEALCTDFSIIREAPLVLPPDLTDDDANLALRLKEELRSWYERYQAVDSVQGLSTAGPLVSLAVHSPRKYRAALTSDAALFLAFFTGRRESESASSTLLERTAERLLRLEASGRECIGDASASEARTEAAHRLEGYAGVGLCYCGMRLNAQDMVTAGLGRLYRTVSCGSMTDCHWENTFTAVDDLLERGFSGADAAALEVATLVQADPQIDAVLQLLAKRSYPRLLDCWHADADTAALSARVRRARKDLDG